VTTAVKNRGTRCTELNCRGTCVKISYRPKTESQAATEQLIEEELFLFANTVTEDSQLKVVVIVVKISVQYEPILNRTLTKQCYLLHI
jgi:hypothetical protein